MSISKTAVNRPTTVLIIFTVLVALGIYIATDLPLDLLPDMELPFVAVNTQWGGAGPEEVEKRITRPIESALSSVSGIEKLGSSSSNGSSLVFVQFTFGTNLDEAMNDIRAYLDFVKPMMPDDATTPMIFKMDPNMLPIMFYAISGSRTPEELRIFTEDLSPRLEQINGVASVNISGGREKAIIIEIPRDRLQAYNLTITQISQMIAAQNMQVASGTITEADYNYTISTVGEYNSIDDIKNTVISYKSPTISNRAAMTEMPTLTTVKLRDIADVYEGYKAQSSMYYLNGVPCIQMSIQKQSGKNSVQTARAVHSKMEEIIAELPSDIKITLAGDTTSIIQRSVDNVASSAIQGALLAVIILFIFLRSFRSTIIIGITIPASIVITLATMYFSGLTLNLMTLAGLALGVGMLVDNSIVILENIYTYREKGAKPVPAAILGSQEMILAITASTLTTICVFVPLILYRNELGIVGELFQGLSFTVVFSLLCSLVVALVLVPVLSSKYFKIGSKKEKTYTGFLGKLDSAMAKAFATVDNAYSKSISWVINHKTITILLIAGLFALSLIFIPVVGFEFIPESSSDDITVSLTMPVGTKLETTEAVLRQLEQIVYEEINGYTHVTVLAGSSGMLGLGGSTSYTGQLSIALPPISERIDSEETIREKLRASFDKFPGAVFSFGGGNAISIAGGASAISINIKSEDLNKAKDTANAIKELLLEKGQDFVTEPQIDLKDGLPQVNIIIDRERLYNLGLNIYSVGQEIKANLAGTTASRYRKDGEETDIIITLAETDKTRVSDLEQIFVTNPQGMRIPVSAFAHYEEGVSPITISREDQSRIVKVSSGVQQGVSLTNVQRGVETLIRENIPQDPSVNISYSGDYQQMIEAFEKFAVIIIMAMILVFAVMASQFESLLDPFIVLFTIPLNVIGIVIVYLLTGQVFNVMTAVGLLILVGVIVNNGIVLIDYTNLLRKRGLKLAEACTEAARSRLRPILMTTLTTVLGLVPMAFFPGEGSEMVQPIGQTILGGLLFGTLMTLFLMPVLYYGFNRMREKRLEKKAQKQLQKA